MADNRIPTGAVEPVQAFVRDKKGDPLAGLTDLFVRVRRDSDGQYFDWSDSTFKAAGWTTLDQVLAESDAANAPGLYEVAGGFDTSGITNAADNEDYLFIPLQTPGKNATLPSPEKVRVGEFADTVAVAARSTVAAGSTSSEIRTGLTQPDGYFADMQMVLVDGTNGAIVRNVNTYTNTNGALMVADLGFTPTVGDLVLVLRRLGRLPASTSNVVASGIDPADC